ncbi:MAG: PAS domain S-box protein [Sedimentisphaerales bacterium]
MGAKTTSGKRPVSAVEKSANDIRQYAGDIIERTNAQEAVLNMLEDLQEAKTFLETSVASFHNIVAKSIDGIVIVAKTGIVQFTNPAAETFLGNGEKKLVGQFFRFPINTGQITEIDIIRDNKEPGVAELRVVETKWNNNPAWLALLRDITDRKQARIKLQKQRDRAQQYLDVAGVMLLVIDQDGKVSLINKKGCEILGYRENEIIGKDWFDTFIPERIREQIKAVEKRIKTGETKELEYCENPVLTKNGEERLIAWHNTILCDEDKKTVKSLCSGEDITERKKTEEKLKKTMEVKSEFTAMVSHELRTPLTAIKEGIALVFDGLAGEVNEEQKELLGISKKNVDRLTRLINGVLDFQKLDSGMMKFNLEANDINKVVKDVYKTMVSVVNNTGLDFLLELDNNLPMFSFDSDKIIQVLENLVTNAMKFTRRGNITIKTSQYSDSIRVSVSDTGCGIKKEDMSKIFNRFEQLGLGGERKTGGTGLGLAISREIIERHNGTIWFESAFGKGSIFTFTLPVCDTEGLLKRYINDGIKDASKNDTKMSLVLISIADFDKLKQELSRDEIDSALKDMEAVLENNLRRAENRPPRAVDNVFKLHSEIFVVLADCDKENTLRVKSRLEQVLDNYLADKNLAGSIKMLWGYAAYPDDAATDEDLIRKARELKLTTPSGVSV